MRLFYVVLLVRLSDTGHPRNSEARVEFGDTVASRLKLSPDGKFILWPQPTDDPEDPQNVRLCPNGVTKRCDINVVPTSGPNGRRPFN
jgi:hypothetical protein